MKIAMVFDTMIYGGIERVGINYCKLLTEMGHEVHAYILNPNTEDIVEDLKKICPVKIRKFSRSMSPDAYWTFALKKSWGKLPFVLGGFIQRLMLPIRKIYLSESEAYDVAIAFSGHMNDLTFLTHDFIKAKTKVGWCHGAQMEYYLISPGFKTLHRQIKNLVCLSEYGDWCIAGENKEYQIRKAKIYNPIYLSKDQVNTEKVALIKETYGDYFLKVARIAEDKDHKTVVDAMKYLKENYGVTNKILFAGDGKLRTEVEAYVKECKMEDQIIFLGNVDNVQDYYAGAKLYVHSSPMEGLPTVLIEAMNFGLPIASTDSNPGAREILGDNCCGLLSPVGDAKALALNMNRLLNDQDLCQNLVLASQEKLKEFTPSVVGEQLTDFLLKLNK